MTYRTLGELRSELLARLGMGAMGASGTAQPLMDSFLRNGQFQLYEAQDWKHLIEYADKQLGVGQNQLDYPENCTRNRRIMRIETVENGQWRTIPEGISTADWSTMDSQSYPIRCQRYAQLLLYPKADAIYTIRFWYVRDLLPFSAQEDRASLDDEMILLHAVTNGKAHYRHPDASLYQGQLETTLGNLRGLSFKTGGVYRREHACEVDRKPMVVGRDVP